MSRPLFKLPARLMLCAQLVRKGVRIADIGTDHARLPVWLCKAGVITYAIAADINENPLKKARETLEKYDALNQVELRLSDGLAKIDESEADDVIIAGMGGELIAGIIARCDWAKNGNKRLIIQPMSKTEYLRGFLLKEGFEIISEKAVLSDGKLYTVILSSYLGKENVSCDPLRIYTGGLDPKNGEYDRQYLKKTALMLKKQSDGARARGDREIAEKLADLKERVEEYAQGI